MHGSDPHSQSQSDSASIWIGLSADTFTSGGGKKSRQPRLADFHGSEPFQQLSSYILDIVFGGLTDDMYTGAAALQVTIIGSKAPIVPEVASDTDCFDSCWVWGLAVAVTTTAVVTAPAATSKLWVSSSGLLGADADATIATVGPFLADVIAQPVCRIVGNQKAQTSACASANQMVALCAGHSQPGTYVEYVNVGMPVRLDATTLHIFGTNPTATIIVFKAT